MRLSSFSNLTSAGFRGSYYVFPNQQLWLCSSSVSNFRIFDLKLKAFVSFNLSAVATLSCEWNPRVLRNWKHSLPPPPRAQDHHLVSVRLSFPPLNPPFLPLLHHSITQEARPSWKQATGAWKGTRAGADGRGGGEGVRMFLSFCRCLSGCRRPHRAPSWGNPAHVTRSRPRAHTHAASFDTWTGGRQQPGAHGRHKDTIKNLTKHCFPECLGNERLEEWTPALCGGPEEVRYRCGEIFSAQLQQTNSLFPVCRWSSHLQEGEILSRWLKQLSKSKSKKIWFTETTYLVVVLFGGGKKHTVYCHIAKPHLSTLLIDCLSCTLQQKISSTKQWRVRQTGHCHYDWCCIHDLRGNKWP